MENKYLTKLLCDAGVYSTEFIPNEKLKNYNKEDLIKESGYNYIVDTQDLKGSETMLAFLAKQTIHLKTIKNIMIAGVVVAVTSFVLILISMYM